MQLHMLTSVSGSFGATARALCKSSTASENMPRCMLATALPFCSRTDPAPESSPSTGGNCEERSQYVRYASSGSPPPSFTAAAAMRYAAESSLFPAASFSSFSPMLIWLQLSASRIVSTCISSTGCALVICAASFQLPSIASTIAWSMAQLMSCVSFAKAPSRSLAEDTCGSFLDLVITAMSAAARCPEISEFCMAFSRSIWGMAKQQRARMAPSSPCVSSLEPFRDSQRFMAFT
mmetsp:Transcript_97382/g.231704  ORF Transcript_97382/g.231704 Transcript_97382/m.231704 type:complete len:235 (+) Transcript_97382:179-883(+)